MSTSTETLTTENAAAGAAELALIAPSSLEKAMASLTSTNSSRIISTFAGEDDETQELVFDAVTGAESLSDNLGKTIMLRNVVIQAIEMPDEKTGELKPVPRIILVDEDGTAYAAISEGIFKSLETIFGLFGQPSTWSKPRPVKAEEKKSRSGFRFLTLTRVKADAAKK